MLRLYLYARVHLLQIAQTARGTAGAGSTRSSLRPLMSMRASEMHSSGETGRENAKSYSVVIVTDKPRVKDAARSRRHDHGQRSNRWAD